MGSRWLLLRITIRILNLVRSLKKKTKLRPWPTIKHWWSKMWHLLYKQCLATSQNIAWQARIGQIRLNLLRDAFEMYHTLFWWCKQNLFDKQCFARLVQKLLAKRISNVWQKMFDRLARSKGQALLVKRTSNVWPTMFDCFARVLGQTFLVKRISNVWPTMFDRLPRVIILRPWANDQTLLQFIKKDKTLLVKHLILAMFLDVAKRSNIYCLTNLKCLTYNVWSFGLRP